MSFELRPYQREMVSKTYASIKACRRKVVVVVGTGGGKGELLKQYLKDARSRGWLVVVLTHREELLIDLRDRFQSVTDDPIGIIKAGYRSDPEAMIQIASVQTMAVRDWWVERVSFYHGRVLFLLEEAHRTAYFQAGQWVLANMDPGDVAIGVTATPVGPPGQPAMGALCNTSVAGPLPVELIAAGYLAPTRCYGLPNGSKLGRRLKVKPEEDTVKAIRFWATKAPGRPTVFFCSGVDHAKDTAAILSRMGYPAAAITGDMSRTERTPIYDAFRAGELRALTCDEILTTGIDWPFLSCIVFLALIDSWRDFIQMVGRAVRTHPGKEYAILIDTAANIETHGTLEDIRPIDYTLDPGAGVRSRAARRQCPACALISPVDLATCECGHTWPVQLHPVLMDVPAAPQLTQDHKIYRTLIRRAYAAGHSPGKALAALKAIRGEGYTPPDDIALLSLFPHPRQHDLDAYHAYLLTITAKVQRRGGVRKDDAWVRREILAQFGPGIDWR